MFSSWVHGVLSPSRRRRRPERASTIRRRRFQPRLEFLEDRRLLIAGTVDLTFGNLGVTAPDNDASAVAIVAEGDGKILLLDQTQAGYNLLRFNTDGTLDATFGDQGKVTATLGPGTAVSALGVLSDGSIEVAGQASTNQQSSLEVARFNYNGTPDTTFGNSGLAQFTLGDGTASSLNFAAQDMVIDASGDVVVDGTSGNALAVVRLNAAGNLDDSFGSNGMVTATLGGAAQAGGLALQPGGQIVVTGFVGNNLAVVRYNGDGSLDTTFGNGGFVSTCRCRGRPWLARMWPLAPAMERSWWLQTPSPASNPKWSPGAGTDQFLLFRFNADGSPDAGFGQQGEVSSSSEYYVYSADQQIGHSVAVQEDGEILVTGDSYFSGTFVSRYAADGSLDPTFGNGGGVSLSTDWGNTGLAIAPALAIQGDGQLVVASDSSTWDGVAHQTGVVVTRLQATSDLRPQQFGSEDAFRQYLIDKTVQQYSSLFGKEQSIITAPRRGRRLGRRPGHLLYH